MTLTLQEISDRIELNDLLTAYSTCVDSADWQGFAGLFTPDALIDYSAMGGSKGGVKETVEFLTKAMGQFESTQHMVANHAVDLQGDRATVKTVCHNPMVMNGGHVFYCGLWYCDQVVRTPDGWRFAERVEEKSYFFNLPEDFVFPE